jgi:hypothetical protein
MYSVWQASTTTRQKEESWTNCHALCRSRQHWKKASLVQARAGCMQSLQTVPVQPAGCGVWAITTACGCRCLTAARAAGSACRRPPAVAAPCRRGRRVPPAAARPADSGVGITSTHYAATTLNFLCFSEVGSAVPSTSDDIIHPVVVKQACRGWRVRVCPAESARADGRTPLVLSHAGMVWLLVTARGQVWA